MLPSSDAVAVGDGMEKMMECEVGYMVAALNLHLSLTLGPSAMIPLEDLLPKHISFLFLLEQLLIKR